MFPRNRLATQLAGFIRTRINVGSPDSSTQVPFHHCDELSHAL